MGQNEQQCHRKLEQLQKTTAPYARALACEWPPKEAWEEDG